MPSLSSHTRQQKQYPQKRQPPALPPPPHHPLLIPELRDQITEDFTVQDFTHCLLVNRLWNKVFTPYLYHTIALRQKALERANTYGVASAASSFPLYGHWVRDLDLRMSDPDTTLDIIRECCPLMETVKLNFGRLLEEQFELYILGIQSPTLLTRFGGVRDLVQATTLKRWKAAAPLTTNTSTGATAGPTLLLPQHQEKRRRSVGTEISTAATAALFDDKDKQMLGVTIARRNSISAFPSLVPLSCATIYEYPVIDPAAITAPPAITVADTTTAAATAATAILDASYWRIPSGRNGFLSNSIKNLQLQVPGDSLYAVLLWLTRAGLDGCLQGIRSFRLSGQESSTVFGIPSSAIHDFLAVHRELEQLTLLSIQVEPAPAEIPWDCLEGSEGSEMLQLMVDSGSSPTPTTATPSITADSGAATKGAGTERNTDPEVTMAAIAAALTAAVTKSSVRAAVYKGIHYKTHIPDYFAHLIAASQSTLEDLKSADPEATRSKVADLHIFQDGQLGPLLSRLPHLLRLTTEFFEQSRISPDLLLPIQASCRSLVSFTYLGKPSCPFADRYPQNNHPSPDPFFSHWESFMQELVHLKELFLLHANLRDEDVRTLVRYGHDRIRVLRIKGETRSTWHGARMVLENCSRLEECTLTCYGPIDELFANTGHPVVLFYPTAAAAATEDEEDRPSEDVDQQDPDTPQVLGRPDPPEWASKDSLRSLCLIGMVLYNDEVNRHLFARLKKLHRLQGLTIAGRGVTLEGLLGENIRLLALEDERLEHEELEAYRQRHEAESGRSGSGGEKSSAPVRCSTCNAPVSITTSVNHKCKKRRNSLYPELETLDLPRLSQKLTSKDLIQLLKELPMLRWMDCGGAYELETLMWLDTRRRDLEALPELDDDVLRIADEESLDANPFFASETDIGTTIARFAANERWQPAEDDNDTRFRVFSESPGTPRPLWLPGFLDYARKRRSYYKKTVSAGKWSKAQRLCLKTLVLRFFEESNAAQSTQALLRASVVFGCFLLCHQRFLGAMTNMVHHLSSSCPPRPSVRTAARPVNQAVEAAVPVKSNRLDRAVTSAHIAVLIWNQQTIMEINNKITEAIAQIYSDDDGSENTVLSDDEEGSANTPVRLHGELAL
ncbi:hypothetical protein BGZ96_012637 [Linnemannia gamsii]|uniref:F-box domain-containing protein n=1 Tax=Linnemannia gamsii TaxID=64522 RepID=A0ABQ7KD10_9FUNG|nr:hypothetical protein BGZ96_012637 [Linnemannia gamsii]